MYEWRATEPVQSKIMLRNTCPISSAP